MLPAPRRTGLRLAAINRSTRQNFDEEATHAHPSLRAAGEAIQLPAPMKQPAVHIMASRRNGTLHTGPTSNLVQRAHRHREGSIPGFTARYGCKLLIWHELQETMESAIQIGRA